MDVWKLHRCPVSSPFDGCLRARGKGLNERSRLQTDEVTLETRVATVMSRVFDEVSVNGPGRAVHCLCDEAHRVL